MRKQEDFRRLAGKGYANPGSGAATTNGPVYSYTAGGRLKTRTWMRSVPGGGSAVVTTYKYGFEGSDAARKHGDLIEVSYNDGTLTTTTGYDRRGRKNTVVRNGLTNTLAYTEADQLLTESYSGGTLGGYSVNRTFDNSLRLQKVELKQGATNLAGAQYGFDTAGRLGTVTDTLATSLVATYGYVANSGLVGSLSFTNGSGSGLMTTKGYDKLNRLLTISSKAYGASAPTLPVGFEYQYNTANQRTRVQVSDGSYWVYGYDELGQVVGGRRYWGDGTAVEGQQFDYAFDDIGNRTSTGGRVSAVSGYSRNYLNQYTQRTVAGAVDVMGVANPTANVTVNGSVASRKGEYFHWPLTVGNGSAQYPTITTISEYGVKATNVGRAFVPATPEVFAHDADGNLTNDGRWAYSWDGENRLIELKRDATSPSGARQKLTFEYDAEGRRIRKVYATNNGSVWVSQSTNLFLYDGWNLVGELDGNGGGRLRTYLWGLDLSGTLQGAGGVGGLLKVTDFVGGTNHHWVAYDGNGNVAALTDASSGAPTARYDYGPFAEPLRATGVVAKKNPFRFSTKYADDQSGFLYYGFRYYNPSTGRWISRDPIGENGGRGIYVLLHNRPIDLVDGDGRKEREPDYHDCSEEQKAQITEAIGKYCKRLEDPEAVDCLTRNKCFRRFKLKSDPVVEKGKTSLAKLEELKRLCASMLVDVYCPKKGEVDPYCRGKAGGVRCGYVIGGSSIHLCPAYNRPECESVGCVMIHEMTHVADPVVENNANRVQVCVGCKSGMPH